MKFQRVGEYLVATRVTGPAHNMLQLQFSERSDIRPDIEALPSIGATKGGNLNAHEVLQFVVAGVAAANAKLQSQYHVGKVRFVENDSGPESIYEQLAAFIVERVAHG